MDIKEKIHFWPDDVFRDYYSETIYAKKNGRLPDASLITEMSKSMKMKIEIILNLIEKEAKRRNI